jgi:xanthine dehydrogenase accessory factor
MMTAAMSRRAQELAAAGAPFATATVVRARRPTSVQPGDVALVLADGTIEGFVGGVCTEHSVRTYALQAMDRGEALLLRVLPFDEEGPPPVDQIADDGAVTVQNPCLSGGSMELFLEPVLPAPRVLVVGDTPIAAALLRVGAELDLDVVAAPEGPLGLRRGDLAVVVAAHGRDELQVLRSALEEAVPYVGLVASRRRGTGVLAELHGDGVPDELLQRIEVPAGLDIGARTPAEVALSILARIVEVRRSVRLERPISARVQAVDPICGMTVAVAADTPVTQTVDGPVYFCCDACKARFEAQVA